MSSLNDLSSFTLPPFANKLIQSGYINLPQIQQALIEKKKTGRSLLEILQEIAGKPLPSEFVRQHKKDHLFNLKILYGIDVFDPETYSFEWKQVEELIDTLIPLEICRRYKLLPLKKRNQQPPSIVVALVNPKDPETLDTLKQILRPKQMKLARKVITQQDYNQLIEQYLNQLHSEESIQIHVAEQDLETLVDVSDIFEDVSQSLRNSNLKTQDNQSLGTHDDQGPVVTLVNNILARALESKASEIQIEPHDHHLNVLFRQDGIIAQAFDPIPKEIAAAVVSRFKTLANLDITQFDTPQKGTMQKSFSGRKIDFWISTLPSRHGEKIIIRILDPKAISLDLETLISNHNTRQLTKHLVSRSSGLFLITGPESSGISTTFYAVLAERNRLGVNLATVENSIEQTLSGVNQVEINDEHRKDSNEVLLSFLNQGVDVIGLDQIRGKNTAKTVVEAALSHLVITTLPTPDTANGIVRLTKMGVDASLLSETLIGVINQRLVRRVCPVCRLSYKPNSSQLSKFPSLFSKQKKVTFYKANVLNSSQKELASSKGRLCRHCNGLGYKGQIGVYEVMGISQRLKTLISQEADAETIKQAAIQEGMTSLLSYAVNLVREGHTTLDELERVFPDLLDFNAIQFCEQLKVSASPEFMRRLHKMEKLLEAVNREFNQLKQDLIVTTESEPNRDTAISSRSELSELRESDELETLKKELEFDKETMITATDSQKDPAVLEPDELELELLKKELESDKETVISADDFKDDEEEQQQVQFVPDPW
ncbi:type II secretion system protein E [Gloeothece citriformis PCC 7424]|uniref:Type II secretion system protein E n=1 Tax=Gloeothece citriformis (strain PCC 7424) TaxID=65393 RepID=B7KHJ1_GLOC7|nr:GspE/PulE family protein [Gloeothece citriformis]ACK70686.1 type II secretion system protein E [Gloeothece citriformis PCC 7424]